MYLSCAWSSNTEIWNFGNINGYVCLRSVMFFGVSGVLLVYMVIPILIKVMSLFDPGVMTIVCRSLALAMIVDGLLYQVNHRQKENSGKDG